MPEIEVRCPACSKRGKIEIEENRFKNVSRGILAINVAKGTVCDHSFVTYVDKNLRIRDSFIADFLIELPELSPETEDSSITPPETEQLDVDLIKLNIPTKLIANVLHGCFMKTNILIIEDKEFLRNHIQNLFTYIMKNAFKTSILVQSSEEYKANKKIYKDFLVLSNNRIISDKHKILEKRKLDVERQMIKLFFEERDSKSSLILLKNEVFKSFDLANKIYNFLESISQEKTINSSIIIEYMENTHEIKLTMSYLKFLLDIVESYFDFTLPKMSDVSDFLSLL